MKGRGIASVVDTGSREIICDTCFDSRMSKGVKATVGGRQRDIVVNDDSVKIRALALSEFLRTKQL